MYHILYYTKYLLFLNVGHFGRKVVSLLRIFNPIKQESSSTIIQLVRDLFRAVVYGTHCVKCGDAAEQTEKGVGLQLTFKCAIKKSIPATIYIHTFSCYYPSTLSILGI